MPKRNLYALYDLKEVCLGVFTLDELYHYFGGRYSKDSLKGYAWYNSKRERARKDFVIEKVNLDDESDIMD